MKRSELKRTGGPTRKAPLRRTGFGRRGDKPSGIGSKPATLRGRKPLRVVVNGEPAQPWNVMAKGETSCRVCGAPATGGLHHAIPRSRSLRGKTDLRNGIPLCKEHHDSWHAGAPICRDVFTDEEWAFLVELEQGNTGWLARRYPPASWFERELEAAA